MERISYVVTDLAGKHISGVRNPGEGKTILLTAAQAEHPLRLGHIAKAPADAPAPGVK